MRAYDISRPPELINIGFDGENKWRPRGFNCTNWLQKHPNGIITLWIQPEGVKKAFPVSITQTENTIVWYPLSEELYPGSGKLQLVIQDGEFIGKSDTIKFEVNKSLVSGGAHPDSQPSWATKMVNDVTTQANRATEAADRAEQASGEEVISEAIEDYFSKHPVIVEETDPTVPDWAKQPDKPTYTAQEVGALPAGTPIPAAVTEQTVAGWGFTKNTGTYNKPAGGIPDSDIASAETWNAKGTYSKPSGGIPKNDLASDVRTSLGKADTALQEHQSLTGYATETWVGNQGYQTAAQVQTAIDPLQTKAITDTGGYYTTDTVEGALQEIGAELAGVNTLIGSGVIT